MMVGCWFHPAKTKLCGCGGLRLLRKSGRGEANDRHVCSSALRRSDSLLK
jgi:hypothetical protein